MNDQEKTKAELIAELQQLKQELAFTQQNFAAIIDTCKQENMALQKSESVLKIAMGGAAIGFWDWDIAHNKVKLSFEWKRMLGFSETEIEDQFEEWRKMVHPDDLENALAKINNHLKGETDRFSFEHRLRSKSGDYLWILSEGKIIEYNQDGAPIHAIGTHKDISIKKQIALDLQKSEETYRKLVDNINDVIYEVSNEGIIKFVGNGVKKLFNNTPEELSGKNILSYVYEPDRAILVKRLASAEAVENVYGELRLVGKNGELRWVSLSSSPHIENGVVVGRIGILTDIGYRKSIEAALLEKNRQLQTLNDNLPGVISFQLIAKKDGSRTFTHLSKEVTQFTGSTAAAIMNDSSLFYKAIAEEDMHVIAAAQLDSITHAVACNIEIKWQMPQQELRWINLIASPEKLDDGNTRWNGIAIDVTKQKLAAEEIVALNKKLKQKVLLGSEQLVATNISLQKEIEEKKIAEKALAESEASYRSIVENINEVIFQTDAAGNWIFLNKSWSTVTGFNVHESLGEPFVNYVHPDDRERNMSLFTPLINREKTYCRHQVRYITKEGGFKWIEVFAKLGLNDKDEITGTYGTLKDVTDRKLAEEALLIEKQRLALIIIGTNAGTWEWNIQTGHVILNEKWANMIGYSLQELEPISIETWGQLTHPEDIKKANRLLEKVFAGELDYYECELRLLHKDGHWEWMLASGNVTEWDADQKALKMSGIHLNITKNKLAEEALQNKTQELEQFFTVSLDMLCITDTAGNLLKTNNAWERVLGYTVDELAQSNFLQFVHPDDMDATLDEIKRLETAQTPTLNFTNRYQTKEGKWRNLQWRSMPVGNRIYAAAADITENMRASEFEKELLELSTKLTGVSASEINDAINLALSKIGQFLEVDRSYVFEFDEQGIIMSNTYDWCAPGIESNKDKLQQLPFDVFPRFKEILNNHQNFNITSVEDLKNDETWDAEYKILGSLGIQSLIIIPLLVENKLIGFVALDSSLIQKNFTNSEINILKVWGSMIATLLTRQQAEALLEQTKYNYETYFNTIDDFLWVLEEDGKITHTNATVLNRLGYTKDELINESILIAYQDDQQKMAAFNMGEILTGKMDYCQIPLMKKSGMQIPVETKLKKGLWNGKPAIFAVNKDVTAIRLSEQKFSNAFHSNSALMSISKISTGELIEVNNEFIELSGYSKQELIGNVSSDLNIFVDPEFRQKVIENIKSNIPVRKVEFKAKTKQGSVLTGLLSADVIEINNEKCLLSVVVDITQRKKEEEDLRIAREEAETANRAKSEFLSRMSHELRTPMNSILGFAQLLEMSTLNPAQVRGVNHILSSGNHLLHLINEVLDISRIESGSFSVSVEPIQLHEVIEDVINSLQPLAKLKQVNLQLVHSPNNLLFVKSDRHRLIQILLNLINNAIKFNRDKGNVTIQVEKLNNDKRVRISITDTGLGIDGEDIPKLFTAFERLGAANTDTEGTGLGLAVVKKLIELLDGVVGVESTPGIGSTFWIELPTADRIVKDARPMLDPLLPAAKTAEFSKTILYVEDNQSNIELIQDIMLHQRPSYKIIYTKFGKQALQMAKESMPDIILLDLNLPDLHGSKVIKILLEDEATKHIPVVVISADAMPQQLKNLLAAGAKTYLPKPININQLLKTVDEWIVQPSQHNTL